jgi:membrane-associated phospholipid phosphatase
LITFLMAVSGIMACLIGHIEFAKLFKPYFATAFAITFVSVLGSIFCWVARLAIIGADRPIRVVAVRLWRRLPMLVLPALVFPLFLVAYTMAKTAIPFLVGYGWDEFWANADQLIFREDAWRIAHDLFGTQSAIALQWVYTVGWGLALIFIPAFVALNAPMRAVATFFTALMGTWFLGGFCMAYSMSAAGPIFTQITDPAFAARFAPLHEILNQSLSVDGPIRSTQAYLASALDARTAVKGGGISAFPSMHLGAASVYVLSAKKSWLLLPAMVFWLVIFICSVYFGYHYWIDGIVAAGVAYACWTVSDLYFQQPKAGRDADGYPIGMMVSN